ncbi:phenazine biosynthesis [Ophiostoma piceae UAMH 11346]|uniref:Phenazine biosynthesis n=1 Tax=Ophiostoma piceae (strain UAMH 11346) TaxID=1262450 RepID=S3CZP4_OPHP1|nr:phenazine biosynthesis [Ophiostoma piceae UAMH 11346]
MSLPFTTLDVFTTQRFGGNPLAVVRVPKTVSVSKSQKQLIAREFALSETVFLHGIDTEKMECEANIFTPHSELPFAGHPVIGSGVYLLNAHKIDKITLLIPAGRLEIEKSSVGVRASVPHDVHLHKKTLRDVIEAGGKVQTTASGKVQTTASGGDPDIANAELDARVYSIVKGMTFFLANVGPDVNTLKKVQPGIPLDPDVAQAVRDKGPWNVGSTGRYFYSITAESSDVIKVQTRMVAGWGIEDPATGSAACSLSCFLTQQQKRVGTTRFEITQGVEMGRPSLISVEVVAKAAEAGDGVEIVTVHLGGSAVEVMRGEVSL